MNDNNLDDLIIDTSTKNAGNKNKNITTIIVLLGIILLIAFLLTKIMMDEPKPSPLAEINETQLANDDLLMDTNSTDSIDLNESATPLPSDINDSALESTIKEEVIKTEETIEPMKAVAPVVAPVQNIAPKVEKKVETAKETVKKETPKVEKKVESAKETVKKETPKVEKKVESTKETVKKDTSTTTSNSSKEYYIQAGAFGSPENVAKAESAIAKSGLKYKSLKREKGTKVMVGPFNSIEKAQSALSIIKSKVNPDAFIAKP